MGIALLYMLVMRNVGMDWRLCLHQSGHRSDKEVVHSHNLSRPAESP